MAIWIFNRGLEWEIIEPDQRHGKRFVDFAEVLRVSEDLAALNRQDLFIHFRPLANLVISGSSWSLALNGRAADAVPVSDQARPISGSLASPRVGSVWRKSDRAVILAPGTAPLSRARPARA